MNVIHRAMRIRQEMKETGRIHISKHRRQWARIVNSIDSMPESLQNRWQIRWFQNCLNFVQPSRLMNQFKILRQTFAKRIA